METPKRTRSCSRQRPDANSTLPRGGKQICVPMSRQEYDDIWDNPGKVRTFLKPLLEQSPELFPEGIEQGYQLSGHLPESAKMPGVRLRQLRIQGEAYTLRPSFVMPYMCGTAEEMENPLLLLSLGVPCWVVTRIFGRDDMYWHRHLQRLGRNSLVGTTVGEANRLPQHLVADEHHADWQGQKGYVACTAAGGCLLGVALNASADEEHLQASYGVFASEARQLDPNYAPQTVNTDGWSATRNAFGTLFAGVVTILCFLHGFLKIRDRCRKARELHKRVWEVYWSETVGEFGKKMRGLWSWVKKGSWPSAVKEMVEKLFKRRHEYAESYSHPECHRTSNLVDRLMNRLTRLLYAGRGLHGHQATSELRLRGWALLENFRPYAKRSGVDREWQSPAHRLRGKRYHSHWIHNLMVSASLAGRKPRT